jgi:hypothetical protein
MRRTLWTVGALALFAVAVAACSSPSISDSQLGFNIVESLLLVSASDNTVGTVVLGSTAGNCPLFQEGADFLQIGSTDFLTFQMESLAPDLLTYLPLTAGTYTILMPSATGPQDAGLYAAVVEYETNDVCANSSTGGNSGTLTIQPFAPDSGPSLASYTVVFGLQRFNGSYPLATCVIPASAPPQLDAGTCLFPGQP